MIKFSSRVGGPKISGRWGPPVGIKAWPIANLSVLSKLLERLVVRQLLDYLNAARLLPELQSAYRAHHSTETAVTKVLADILLALDTGDLSMLTLLDLSEIGRAHV